MGIELIVYIYCAICISMLFFNFACIFVFKQQEKKIHNRSRSLEHRTKAQLERIREGKAVEEHYIAFLNKKLSMIGNLMAFDEFAEELWESDRALAEQYFYEIRTVILHISVVYLKKETIQSGYFLYLLSKYRLSAYLSFDFFMDILKEYLKKDGLYCKTNVMNVLYGLGNADYVLEAVRLLDKTQIFYHGKILTDGLLTFQGDHEELIEKLWDCLTEFQMATQVSILNYIRFRTGEYCEEMFEILNHPDSDPELHYAAIRYFGKYRYQPAWPLLSSFTLETDPLRWNYAAFSATSLANYPGKETLEVLKQALANSNWHVRYNAAQSIDRIGVNYYDLIDIMNGTDRYAREIMNYYLDARRRKEIKEE